MKERAQPELVGTDGSQIPHVLCMSEGSCPCLAPFQHCRGAGGSGAVGGAARTSTVHGKQE